MKFPLKQFEQYFDEQILDRGLTYFLKGFVYEPEEITRGVLSFPVEGSEVYFVTITMEPDYQVEAVCTCPYEGEFCKHVAAVCFYMQKDELEITEPPRSRKKKSPTKKKARKTIAEQIDELLEAIPEPELRAFIRQAAVDDRSFRLAFTTTFSHLVNDESKTFYAKQIRAVLNAAKKRGFISWGDSRKVSTQLQPMLDNAYAEFKRGNVQRALWISGALLEELTKSIQFTDDSGGYLGEDIHSALHLLTEISMLQLEDNLRKNVFDYALKTFKSKVLEGWDWHLSILSIAINLVKTEKETQTIQSILADFISKAADYDRSEALLLQVQLLKHTGSEEEVQQLLHQNLSDPSIREEAIMDLIRKKDYKRAKELANDGIQTDPPHLPGLTIRWQNYLLQIAQHEGDHKTLMQLARDLFMKDIHDAFRYFDILKDHTSVSEWEILRSELIGDLKSDARWYNIHTLAELYAREEMWDDLLTYLDDNLREHRINIELVSKYEKHLTPAYSADIARMYELSVLLHLENNVGRSHYRTACKYIKRMKKLGAEKQAETLIGHLRKLYANRPALLEELDKIS